MRICLNTYPWAFGVPGGGERQLHNYHDALVRGASKWPKLEATLFNPWSPQFEEIDLMHYFGCLPSGVDFLDFVKVKQHIPLVMSPNFFPDPEGWAKSGVLDAIKTNLWLADKIIVNSFIEEEALVRLMQIDSSRISIIPNGVDDLFFQKISPNIFRDVFNIEGAYVLNVGNVEPRKNQLAMLKALKAFPSLQLVTIGGIREAWYSDACQAEGGGQFVSIPALKPGSELLRSAMAGCEFFAMPSLVETPSIASLEAGAAGCKILTTDLGSTTEYFKNHVTYINPYDVLQIQSGIELVLFEKNSSILSDHIQANYRWDIVVERLVATYESVLNTSFS